MSGVSLAVAHTHGSDTNKTNAHQQTKTQNQQDHQAMATAHGGMMGSLRWIELQLVAFVMVFSAIGLVPLFDLLFPAFITAYLLILSRLAFPGSSNRNKEEIVQGSAMLRGHAVMGTVIGLFLPLAYVLGGYARGDEQAVGLAAPQLFLLSFQILTENVISALSLFSAPVRALVPMLYTVRRLFVILDWIQHVLLNKSLNTDAHIQDIAWYWFGISLAVANLAYFSINIFAFLIPRFLPNAFEQYFKERNETLAKLAEDKRESSDQPKDKKSN
ncbi:hypothetical protein OSB04_018615 [Centaurea solstitialis]|uniref:DUF7733 domain-containing protein n=1 Tax=Centaurea solstitialis TaxID=347529 RepID=A0AA38WJH4_9ASTR|nr:hypothetical protein OSB04_018615 [Centaurea solstitialis]